MRGDIESRVTKLEVQLADLTVMVKKWYTERLSGGFVEGMPVTTSEVLTGTEISSSAPAPCPECHGKERWERDEYGNKMPVPCPRCHPAPAGEPCLECGGADGKHRETCVYVKIWPCPECGSSTDEGHSPFCPNRPLWKLAVVKESLTTAQPAPAGEPLPLTHVWKAEDGTVKAKLYGTPDIDLVVLTAERDRLAKMVDEDTVRLAEASKLEHSLRDDLAAVIEVADGRLTVPLDSTTSLALRQVQKLRQVADTALADLAAKEERIGVLEHDLSCSESSLASVREHYEAQSQAIAVAREALEEIRARFCACSAYQVLGTLCTACSMTHEALARMGER